MIFARSATLKKNLPNPVENENRDGPMPQAACMSFQLTGSQNPALSITTVTSRVINQNNLFLYHTLETPYAFRIRDSDFDNAEELTPR